MNSWGKWAVEKGMNFFLKVWWHAATLLIYFFYINRAVIQYLYILLIENPSWYPHCIRSVEGLLWGAEPRFKLGPAVQQANALQSQPHRTLSEPLCGTRLLSRG
jgi:hypothetical protein